MINTMKGQPADSQLPHQVNRIIKKRINRMGQLKYFVRWDRPDQEGSWVDEKLLQNEKEAILKFESELLKQKKKKKREAEEARKAQESKEQPAFIVISDDSAPEKQMRDLNIESQKIQEKKEEVCKKQEEIKNSASSSKIADWIIKKVLAKQTKAMKQEEEPNDVEKPQPAEVKRCEDVPMIVPNSSQIVPVPPRYQEDKVLVSRLHPITGEKNEYMETKTAMKQKTAILELIATQRPSSQPVKIVKAQKNQDGKVMLVIEKAGSYMQVAESQFRKYWHQQLIEYYRSGFDLITMRKRTNLLEQQI